MKPTVMYGLTATTTLASKSATNEFQKGSTAVGKVV